MNSIIIMGRLTKNPELRKTNSGTSVLSFTVAVDRGHKDDNGFRAVDFIDCVAWRKTAEFINAYFKKGQMIAVQGSLRVRTYETDDAQKRKVVEVQADSVYFCSSRNEQEREAENTPKQDEYIDPYGNLYDIGDSDDDELPF